MNANARNAANKPTSPETVRAARRLMREHYSIILATERGVRAGEAKPLHDLRVAIRRFRTLLRIFAPLYGPDARRMEDRFDRLQKALGPARDADVLIGILQSRMGRRMLAGTKVREKLLDRQSAARRLKKDAVRALMSGATYRRLKHDAARLVGTAPSARGTACPNLRRLAGTAVRKALARVERRSEMPASRPADAIHRLRIACRRGRYICEFFGETLGPEFTALGQRLKTLQDILGDVHDLDVLVAELKRERVAIPEALYDALRQRRKKLLRRLDKANKWHEETPGKGPML